MADATNDKTAGKSAEEIDKELTVGKFAGQQVRTLVIVGGATLLAGGAAFALGKWAGAKELLAKQKWFRKSTGIETKLTKLADLNAGELAENNKEIEKVAHMAITGAGGLVGVIGGGMMSDYEHWRKVKGEQLGVEKINYDVDTVMKSRVQFEDTLNQQRETISAMRQRLEGEKKETMAEKVIADKEKAPTERSVP